MSHTICWSVKGFSHNNDRKLLPAHKWRSKRNSEPNKFESAKFPPEKAETDAYESWEPEQTLTPPSGRRRKALEFDELIGAQAMKIINYL